MGTLAIGDREFAITEATLSGGLYTESGETRVGATGTWLGRTKGQSDERPQWRCNWILNVKTGEREFPSDDPEYPDPVSWEPRAYSDDLPVQVHSWREFDGLTIECDGPSREKKCQLVGPFYLYVSEHADVTRNRLHFSRLSGATFDLVWEGLCDIYASDEYYEEIPFRVQTSVEFLGIRIVESDPARAHGAISQVLDPNEYVQHAPEPWDWGDEEPPDDGPYADIWFKPKLSPVH